jgi:hypothetical protein
VEKDLNKTKITKKAVHHYRSTLAELGFTARVLHHVMFAGSASLSALAVFTAFFYFTAHGSFNHIYIGTIPIKATDSQKQIEQKISGAAQKYQITLLYPDGSKKTYQLMHQCLSGCVGGSR